MSVHDMSGMLQVLEMIINYCVALDLKNQIVKSQIYKLFQLWYLGTLDWK